MSGLPVSRRSIVAAGVAGGVVLTLGVGAFEVQAQSTGATPLASSIAAQLAAQAVVRAQFTQTRQMAALKRPVVSSGQMTYARDAGILWQIEKPVVLAYALSGDRILETGADGVQRERQVPALTQVTRVMRSLMGADIAALSGFFDVSATGELRRWTLRLTPRQAQLAQVISGLEITGGRFIESIRIDEAGGDSTAMTFTGSQAASALTDDERRLFGLGRK